jgi:TolB-like protein
LIANITNEFINTLSKNEGINVASYLAISKYENSDESIFEIAKKLDVDNLIDGSFMRSGESIRLTVMLYDARKEKHLWSEAYDRSISDLPNIQDNITKEVVKILLPE